MRKASLVNRLLRSRPDFMVQVIYSYRRIQPNKEISLLFNNFSKSKLRYFTIDNVQIVYFLCSLTSILCYGACTMKHCLVRNLIAMVYLQTIYNLKKRS